MGDHDGYNHSAIQRMEKSIQKAYQHRPVQQQDDDEIFELAQLYLATTDADRVD